ncbi:flippase [Aeromonas sp. SrichE-2G]|uniref:flippase n=1 Tax=Aeromonas sp. SrichE-2G TaxID=2823359 RepID=UPI001B345292|nr:flippase [Aeromonas sp. SrichE-2G]MBP4043189.1 flippase [Aeromonas sp. SrichE-2G]
MDRLLLKNIFSLFSIQAVNYILPLLIIPRLVQVLGVDLFGVYILIFTVIQYFIILSEYGFNLTATRKLAINIDNKKFVSKVFSSVILSKLMIAALGFSIINSYVLLTSTYREHLIYFNLGYLSVFGSVFFPVWLYQAYEKMQWIAVCNFISRVSGVVLIYILVNDKHDFSLAIILQASMPLVASVISLFYCFSTRMVFFARVNFQDIAVEIKDGWDIFVSTSFVSLYTTSVPLILGYTSGAASVGIYAAADKIRLAVQSIINPVSQALYPRLSRLMLEKQDEAYGIIRTVFKFFVIPFFVLSLILMCFSEHIINVLYGDSLPGAVIVLKILIWIPPVVAIANMLGIQIMLPKGMTKEFSITYIVSGVIGFPLLITGAYYFSVIGVSIISVFIEVVVISLFLMFLKGRSSCSSH